MAFSSKRSHNCTPSFLANPVLPPGGKECSARLWAHHAGACIGERLDDGSSALKTVHSTHEFLTVFPIQFSVILPKEREDTLEDADGFPRCSTEENVVSGERHGKSGGNLAVRNECLARLLISNFSVSRKSGISLKCFQCIACDIAEVGR